MEEKKKRVRGIWNWRLLAFGVRLGFVQDISMALLLGIEAKVTNMVGAWVNKSSARMLHNTRTEQFVNNIRKRKRIESQKVRERFRVKVWAVVTDSLCVVTDNLGLG